MPPYLSDRREMIDASDLMAHHGDWAAAEAAQRASRSRDLGNHLHFCRWRRIERWIDWLASDGSDGTRH